MWNLGYSIDSNAYSWRRIKPGTEYDHLFPKASGEVEIINEHSEDIDETMKLVYRNSIHYASDTAKLAPLLRGKTLYETLKNIWTFTYNHLQYKIDEAGKEQVRRPKRSWADRHKGVDCDCMSVFVGSILYNLHIDFKYRITMYEGSRSWQHIYVIVPVNAREYYVIDCVLHQFNFEKLPIKQYKDYDIMQLSSLNGVDGGMGVILKKKATPASNQRNANQKGGNTSSKPTIKQKIQSVVQKATAGKPNMTLKEKVQNVGKAFVKVVGAPSRNSFLLLFKVAKLTGITKKLREGAQKQWNSSMKSTASEWEKWHKVYLDLSEMWTKKLQGQQFALDRAINGKEFAEGNTIRGLGRAISDKEWYLMDAEPYFSQSYINGFGATGIEEGALMAAAAPVLIAFFDLLQKGGVLSKDKTSSQYAQDILGDKEFNDASALVNTQAANAGDTEVAENGGADASQRVAKGIGDFWEQYKMPILIGGGALAIGVGYWAWQQNQASKPKKSSSNLSGVRRKKRKTKVQRKKAKIVHLD